MRAFLQTCCLHRFTYFTVTFNFEVLPSSAALPSDGAKKEDVVFHSKITVFGVFYSEIVDRAASHAACMAFESFWSTQPFTLLARLPTQASCHLTRRLYGFCKLLFVKIPARVNPQIRTVRTGKFLSFSWFSFCVVYPVWRPGPQYNVRLVRQTFTSGGSGLGCPAPSAF